MQNLENYIQLIFVFVLLGYFSVLIWVIKSNASDLPKSFADINYILILGAKLNDDGPSQALKYRLDATLNFLSENDLNVNIIVSGAQGKDEPMSEALGMKRYLIDHGISQDRIIMEYKSTSTVTNLQYSYQLVSKDDCILIVSNGFHMFRTRYLANKCGMSVYTLSAPTNKDVFGVKSYLREPVAFVKAAFFD